MAIKRCLMLASGLVLFSAPVLHAQGIPTPVYDAPVAMFGYVVNAPQQLLGGGVAYLPPALGGWGLYADAKMRIGSPEDDDWFLTDVTVAEAEAAGDLPQDDRYVWQSFNLAVVRAFRDDLVLYLGGGLSNATLYLEYFDPSMERADFGYYWIRDPEGDEEQFNVMGGMFFRLARHVMIQFGAESAPRGFTVGILGVI